MRKFGTQALFMALTWTSLCFVALPGLSAQSSSGEPESFRQASEGDEERHLIQLARVFQAAAKQAPDFAPAHFTLALVREEQGRI